jgi:sentrin-specific protease 1
VDAHNIELTGELMRCLRPLTWLNDEVINLYMELLRVRNNRKPDSLKCHFFNSFFYTKMLQGGYQYKNVRRWSKRAKIKVIEMDRVFVPINVNNSHWVLAVINFSEKRFEYHDSLYGNGSACLRQLRQYVADEANHYHDGMQYDFTGWTSVNIRDCPSQHNGSDCGVFTCKNADYLSDSREALFTQSDINYFRRRMVLELHNKFIQ